MRTQEIIRSLTLITVSIFLVACFEPTAEEIEASAEEKVLTLLRTHDYELLSDRDKAAGTEKDFQELPLWRNPEVLSGESHKYYELESLLVEQSEYRIKSSSYDPKTGTTTVTPEWVIPSLYSELIVTQSGVYETENSIRALQRFNAGLLTSENIKREHFELQPLVVDETGVYMGLKNILAVQAVAKKVSDETTLLRKLGVLAKTTLDELAQLDALEEAIDAVEEAEKEIQQLDPNQKGIFRKALSMGGDAHAEIQLLQKTLNTVSFSKPTITKYRNGRIGIDTMLKASEPLPVRLLYCMIEYYDGEQKIGEEESICGQDLHRNLVQDRGRLVENTIAAKTASRIKIRVTGISTTSDF